MVLNFGLDYCVIFIEDFEVGDKLCLLTCTVVFVFMLMLMIMFVLMSHEPFMSCE